MDSSVQIEPPFPSRVDAVIRRLVPALVVGLALAVGAGDSARLLAAAPVPTRCSEEPDEYEVKAAFLYLFTTYVTWPESAFESEDDPFVVAVLGDDPFDGGLGQTFEDRTHDGRAFRVEVFSDVEDLEDCHLLFVERGCADELGEALEVLDGFPTLVVGESPGLAAAGAGINFFHEKKKTRFEVNPDATGRAGLTVSSDLMDLARVVRDEEDDDAGDAGSGVDRKRERQR